MKRFFVVWAMLIIVCACEELNDLENFGDPTIGDLDSSEITDRLDDLEERVSKLETLCISLNANLMALQEIVTAMETGDYITSVMPITEAGIEVGYVISFASGTSISVYHGKDSLTDAILPEIGISQDAADSLWYWTIDGEWLLDNNGAKVEAISGSNGKDGVTPQLKIENDYWYVSYNNGLDWIELGKATGEDGKDGIGGGETIFTAVNWDSDYVYFVLASGESIKIPKTTDSGLNIIFDVKQGTPILSGQTMEIGYTIIGGDEGNLVKLIVDCRVFDASIYQETTDSGIIYLHYWDILEENHIYMSLLVSVSDGKGNSVCKSLNLDEGILEDISDAYLADVEGGLLEVTFRTNMDYTVSIPEDATWISCTMTKGAARTETLAFNIEPNTDNKYRSALIQLMNGNNCLRSFTIGQGTANSDEEIVFADSRVKEACLKCFDYDSDGIFTYEEAAMVKDLWTLEMPSEVTSFDELQYFVGLEEIQEGFFSKCWCLKSVRLPEQIKYIGCGAFRDCLELTSINLPDSLETLEPEAFRNTGLRNITIPERLKYIGEYCFSGCHRLKRVTFPQNGELTIGWYAFSNSYLTSLNLPCSIYAIYDGAFADCHNLTSITVLSETPCFCASNAFPSDAVITVPDGCYEAYYAAWGTDYNWAVSPDGSSEIEAESEWGVSGTFTNWESDIMMTLEGDWYVATITCEDNCEFLFRKNQTWDESVLGISQEQSNIVEEYNWYPMVPWGIPIIIPTAGTYRVYLSTDLLNFYYAAYNPQ